MKKRKLAATRLVPMFLVVAIALAGVISFSVAKSPKPEANTATKRDKKTAANRDWPMWGGLPSRNMVNTTTGLNFEFQLANKKKGLVNERVNWMARLGSPPALPPSRAHATCAAPGPWQASQATLISENVVSKRLSFARYPLRRFVE